MVEDWNTTPPCAVHPGSSSSCDALFVQTRNPEVFEVFLLGPGESAGTTVKHRAVPTHSLVSMSPILRERCLHSGGRFLISKFEIAESLRNSQTLTELQKVAIRGAITMSVWDTFLRHVGASRIDCSQDPLLKRIDTLQQQLVSLSICSDASAHERLMVEVETILNEVRKCALDMCGFSAEEVAIKSQLRAALQSKGRGLLTLSIAVISRLRQLVQVHVPQSLEQSAQGSVDTLHLLLLAVALKAEHLVNTCLTAIAHRWPEIVLCPSTPHSDVSNADAILSLLPPGMQEQLGVLLGATPKARSLLERQERAESYQASVPGVHEQSVALPDDASSNKDDQTVSEIAKSQEGQLSSYLPPASVQVSTPMPCWAQDQVDDVQMQVEEVEDADVQTPRDEQEVRVPEFGQRTEATDQSASDQSSLPRRNFFKQRNNPFKDASVLSRQNLFEQRARQLQEKLQRLPQVPLRGIAAVEKENVEPASSPSESRLRQPTKRKSHEQMSRIETSKTGLRDVDSIPHLIAKPGSCSEERVRDQLIDRSSSVDTTGVEKVARSMTTEQSIARKFLDVPAKASSVESVPVQKVAEVQKQAEICATVTKCKQSQKDDSCAVTRDAAHSPSGLAKVEQSSNKAPETKAENRISKAAALAAIWLAHDEPPACPALRPKNDEQLLDVSTGRHSCLKSENQDSGVTLKTAEEDFATNVNEEGGRYDDGKGSASTTSRSLVSHPDRSQRPQQRSAESATVQRSESVETSAVRRAQRRLAERRRKLEQSEASRLSESEVRRAELFRKRDERIRCFIQRQDCTVQDASKQSASINSLSNGQEETMTDIANSTTRSHDYSESGTLRDLVHSTPSECKNSLDSTITPEKDSLSPPSRVASRIAHMFVCGEDNDYEDICRPVPPQPHPMS